MMDRRRFLLTSLAGGLAAPLAANAQQSGKVYQIGFLSSQQPTDPEVSRLLGVFVQELRNLGYAEGRNIVIEYRWAERAELPDFAIELVRLKVDVIVAASPPAAFAAKNATRTIPIVTVLGAWHVGSLARPSDNVTGLSSIAVELGPKLLELLREAVPKVSRVAVLSNPANNVSAPQLREVEGAARVLGVQLQRLEAQGSEQFDSAFAAMTRERADALLVLSDAIFWNHRTQIANLATKSRLPAIYGRLEHVEAGGLMAYAPSNADLLRRAATYVDEDPEGREAGRSASRAADEIRAGHQPQDRQGPRPHDPAVAAGCGRIR